MMMAWKGMGDDPKIYWNRLQGSTWSAQQTVPGVGTSVDPALAPIPGTAGNVYLAWRGQGDDQKIYWSRFDGTAWSTQKVVPDVATGGRLALADF